MHKVVISCDWFQYYLFVSSLDELEQSYHGLEKDYCGYIRDYEIKRATEFSPVFNEHFSVVVRGQTYFHCHYKPKSSALNSHLAIIKVDNWLLYQRDWQFYLHDFIAAIGWQIGGISRIDLCADFNEFANGMRPANFAKRYLAAPTKKACSFARCQSDKWCAVGQKSTSGAEVSYLRWGGRQSAVCTYLYDKSKELREVKNKPWIVRKWIEADLDVKNVWRVEFSINSKGTLMYDWDKRSFSRLKSDDILTQKVVENLFWAYQNDYFHFKRLEVGEDRNKREWEDFYPLDRNNEITVRPRSIYRQLQSGKTTKMLYKKLDEFKQTDSDFTPKQYEAINETMRLLNEKYFLERAAYKACSNAAAEIIEKTPFLSDLRDAETAHNFQPTYLQQIRERGRTYRDFVERLHNRRGRDCTRVFLEYRQIIPQVKLAIMQALSASV